ncbi:MAG: hypothetical protein AAF153_00945 [Pseudomonadota bacterium]
MSKFTLTINTPSGTKYQEHINQVIIPGIDGELGILLGHSKMISPTNTGKIIINPAKGSNTSFNLGPGIAHVEPNAVVICCDSCE